MHEEKKYKRYHREEEMECSHFKTTITIDAYNICIVPFFARRAAVVF
jgi:hypothetical protein